MFDLDWKPYVSLKTPVILAFVVLWNAGFLLAMHLGGGGVEGALSPVGTKVSGVVCLAAAIFGLTVARSESVQAVLIAPTRAKNFRSKEFYFLAIVAGFIGIGSFVFP